MENKQILLIGAIILIAIAIICTTLVFLNNNDNNQVNNQANNITKDTTADQVNTEDTQQEPQKDVYAYTSDGSPLYSYQEAKDYITQKYGPDMIWHVQDNKYISLDTPGFTSDGRKMY